ncbi:unnamed protein product [Sphagnum balticum]
MLLRLEQGLGHVFNGAPMRRCGLHQRSHARGLLQFTKLHLRRVVVMEEFDNTVAILDEIVKVIERVAVKVRWFYVATLLGFRRSEHILDKQVQAM